MPRVGVRVGTRVCRTEGQSSFTVRAPPEVSHDPRLLPHAPLDIQVNAQVRRTEGQSSFTVRAPPGVSRDSRLLPHAPSDIRVGAQSRRTEGQYNPSRWARRLESAMTLGSFPCPESASESAHGSAAPKGNIILHGAREAWSQPTISRPTHPAARPRVAASRSPCRGALSTPAGTPSPEGITFHHNGQCTHEFWAITVHYHTPSTVEKFDDRPHIIQAVAFTQLRTERSKSQTTCSNFNTVIQSPSDNSTLTDHLLQLRHNHSPLQTIQRSQATLPQLRHHNTPLETSSHSGPPQIQQIADTIRVTPPEPRPLLRRLLVVAT